MPRDTHELREWLSRVKAVEREFYAARSTVERMRGLVARGEAVLTDAGVGDLESAAQNLESTYMIRLWAEFETAVRSYYGWRRNEPFSRIRTRDLIDAVAGVRLGRAISGDVRERVHAVREYRNSLIHARGDSSTAVALSDARRVLNLYLCRLPETWG